ncbi:MAG TPA: nitronate monooxygenase [Solirubrobacteraceae bacterium]|nr:nitronate monooxygenase [Solirubrobacteraceae bacterium]
MILDTLEIPIVLAPLAGGPATVDLAVAVSDAGGLGFLAAGYRTAADMRDQVGAFRDRSEMPFGINVFTPPAFPDRARRLCELRRALAKRSRRTGLRGGGHRASFSDGTESDYGLLTLLQLVGADAKGALIAAGGIATGRGVAAALAAGARAAQIGAAFLRCPEAGTSAVHRAALTRAAPTALTRAFTASPARVIVNRFMREHGDAAPSAYPELHHVTAPLRQAGRKPRRPRCREPLGRASPRAQHRGARGGHRTPACRRGPCGPATGRRRARRVTRHCAGRPADTCVGRSVSSATNAQNPPVIPRRVAMRHARSVSPDARLEGYGGRFHG